MGYSELVLGLVLRILISTPELVLGLVVRILISTPEPVLGLVVRILVLLPQSWCFSSQAHIPDVWVVRILILLPQKGVLVLRHTYPFGAYARKGKGSNTLRT